MNKFISIIKQILRRFIKAVASILLILIIAVAATSISPIYDFEEARSFEGAEIYNPYKSFDAAKLWKRANFHTHTRVEGILNECDYWPNEVLEAYDSLGYDIVTFSNHNKKTTHPKGAEYQSNGYEHGYNLLKYHKNIERDVEEVLRLYFLTCSVEMNCCELAKAFLALANHAETFCYAGIELTRSQIKRMNAIMQTCGFYDEAGEFTYLVGLPGKSGVGGGIVAVHPAHYSVAVWSPRLNPKGNSVMGMKALELFTT